MLRVYYFLTSIKLYSAVEQAQIYSLGVSIRSISRVGHVQTWFTGNYKLKLALAPQILFI